MNAEFSVTARWVFPVSHPPIEGGVVSIRNGRIVAVEPPGMRTADFDFGNAAIVPGFVNAHTHLDLNGARGLTPPQSDFTRWLRSVIAYRQARTQQQVNDDIRRGIAESLTLGTTLLGDIAVGGLSWDHLAKAPIRSLVFREFVGLRAERAVDAILDVAQWLGERLDTPSCRRGISPHAPYSVRVAAIQMAAESWGVPLAIHLAETTDEIRLLQTESGPFVAFLEEMGAWDEAGLAVNAEQVVNVVQAAPRALLIHANYLAPDVPVGPRVSVVYCPRTNAAFGHPSHPFREFLNRGVRVALGTDSLASNPDLSILAEARFIASRYRDLNRATLLRMATLSGAEAFGWESETGGLEVGKSPDFAVVALPDRESADPHELLFDSDLAVQSTWFQGKCVYSALPSAGAPGCD